jgi:hypothetical protein
MVTESYLYGEGIEYNILLTSGISWGYDSSDNSNCNKNCVSRINSIAYDKCYYSILIDRV